MCISQVAPPRSDDVTPSLPPTPRLLLLLLVVAAVVQLTRSASRRAYTSGSSVIDQPLSADPPWIIARWKRLRPAATTPLYITAAGDKTTIRIAHRIRPI